MNVVRQFTPFKFIIKPSVVFFLAIFCIPLLLAVRGYLGNPNSTELQTDKWRLNGPFELSPERGRYALTYSLVNDKSFTFSLPVARFATPDLGYANGKYVSLFAPFVSFTAIPGYIIGKAFGIAQVGAFLTISLFALFNGLLIRGIAKKLGSTELAANIAALVFLSATPAFAYAVTLYQHHISVFLILLSLYILLRWKNWLSLSAIWLLVATSLFIDYPNAVMMTPIGIYALSRFFDTKKAKGLVTIGIKFWYFLTPVVVILPLLFYVWFSYGSYGKPFQLAGTVQGVRAIDTNGKPTDANLLSIKASPDQIENQKKTKKTAVGFFQPRNFVNGLYIHFVSPDRGVIFYAPIVLFGIFGAIYLWSKKQKELVLLLSIVCANVVLYSMWGDPWGGWAFGSRYLIPSYAIMAILVAFAFKKFNKNALFYISFFLVGVYSIAVNTLGAITTNANPPQVEVLALEKLSGVQERYMFDRNYFYLLNTGSKSFAYNTFLSKILTPVQYYVFLAIVLTALLNGLMVAQLLKKHD